MPGAMPAGRSAVMLVSVARSTVNAVCASTTVGVAEPNPSPLIVIWVLAVFSIELRISG
jgi:hypothetical protein